MDEKEAKAYAEALLKSGQLPDRQLKGTLFNLARAYSETGDMAMQHMDGSRNADFCAPAVMCKSFAAELLLRFFVVSAHPGDDTARELMDKGVKLKGHPYSALYDRIPLDQRKNIARFYSEASGEVVDEVQFRGILTKDLGDQPFVAWRYLYELAGTGTVKFINFGRLHKVVDALGRAAEGLLKATR